MNEIWIEGIINKKRIYVVIKNGLDSPIILSSAPYTIWFWLDGGKRALRETRLKLMNGGDEFDMLNSITLAVSFLSRFNTYHFFPPQRATTSQMPGHNIK